MMSRLIFRPAIRTLSPSTDRRRLLFSLQQLRQGHQYSPLIKRNRIPFINFETGAPKANMSQPSVVTPFTQEKQRKILKLVNETAPLRLFRGRVIPQLSTFRFRGGGRLMTGQIGVFHRGGGHRQRLRLIDYKRGRKDIYATVLRIEYCPGRTSFLALIQYTDGVLSYIVAPETLRPGDRVVASEKAPITPGNSLPLRNIPAGTIIHNLEPRPGAGGQINRSAGCFAAIMSKDSQWATIKLNSTEIKRFPLDCWAVVGQVGNANFWARAKGHCRVKRWLGWRPSVHGVAKNPVEHPHGGGTSHKGPKRNPVSPWGGLVLQKTRSRHKPRTNVISPPSGATTRGV